MNRNWIVGITAVVMVAVVAGWACADIKGSKHDFSTDAWEGVDECGACHTPPGEKPPTPPLWNSRADLTKRFGRALDRSKEPDRQTMTKLGQGYRPSLADSKPGSGTLSCLQCHDGTIAKDAAAAAALPKKRLTNTFHPGRFATGHGRTDHPVGIRYPKIAKGYPSATSVISGWKVKLPEGKVECTSCHDPHDESAEKHMLVMSNARSALCLKCHKK
ncbi:MAG: cytochrome c3 family protein [bacterium]|nr:cytochrome c3 family protein [bacterium]